MYQNLRSAMAGKGITIDQMADLLHVHRNTISNKLDGESEFTFGQANKIADCLFPEYRPSFLFRRFEKRQERKTCDNLM